jgi:hypothetical protein
MGVPAVVTNIRGCREVVEHDRNGLLIPVKDVRALADAIAALLTNRDRARRLGRIGRVMAATRFDEQVIFDRVKREYARLLLEKGLAPSARALEHSRQEHGREGALPTAGGGVSSTWRTLPASAETSAERHRP